MTAGTKKGGTMETQEFCDLLEAVPEMTIKQRRDLRHELMTHYDYDRNEDNQNREKHQGELNGIN